MIGHARWARRAVRHILSCGRDGAECIQEFVVVTKANRTKQRREMPCLSPVC